jgi:hypothetical protein
VDTFKSPSLLIRYISSLEFSSEPMISLRNTSLSRNENFPVYAIFSWD